MSERAQSPPLPGHGSTADVYSRIDDAVFALDEQWRFTYLNDQAEEVFQRRESDLVGEVIWDAYPEATESTFRQEYERAMATQEPVTFEEYYPPLGGWFEVRAYPSETGLSVYLRDVTDRVSREEDLRRRERALRRAYEIVADPDATFSEQVDDLLAVVREAVGTDLATLSHIRPEEDEYVYEAVDVPAGVDIQAGDVVPLSELPVCANVAETGESLAVGDVGAEVPELANQTWGITTYLGAPVVVDGESYGTFCFYSTEPRGEAFSDWDLAFVELLSSWVSYELEREAHERYLERLYEIVADHSWSFEEKIGRLLDLGRERLGVDIGMLTRERKDAFEIEQMRGEHPVLDEGTLTPPMTDNYCRRVVDTGEQHTVADCGAAGWDEDALYHEFDLRCYAGVPLDDESTYGTILFTDLSARDREFDDAEQTFVELMGQCVSHEIQRKRREDRLTALNTLSRELMNTDSVAETAEYVVESAEETLDLPVTAVARYDRSAGRLRPTTHTDAAGDLLAATSLLSTGEGTGWQSFAEDTVQRETEPLAGVDADLHPAVTEVVVFPLGKQGVFVVGSTASSGFDAADFEFVETVAGNVRAAFERIVRETELQEREETLTEHNDALERLNRINDTIRSIDKGLVSASSREAVERVVCERLAETGPYEMAWVGDADGLSREITPREWAGDERGYLDDVAVSPDGEGGRSGPSGRAMATGETQVVSNILEAREYEWRRQEALTRGYHSTIALPLTYDDERYGVLTIYAGRPGVFDELERTVLTELSDNIAYAINAVESKKALVGDEVTELELELRDDRVGLVALADEQDCTCSLKDVVPRSDGGFRAFFTLRGALDTDADDLGSAAALSDLSVVTEREEAGETVRLVEATLEEASLATTVLEHGGTLRGLDAADGVATATIHLAAGADVREFTEMLRAKYDDAALVAKRTRQRPARTPMEFTAAVTDEMTARQAEVLQTAYHSGYFEQPRSRTGSEIADAMDITQPTFNAHLRTAQRKLYRKLFEAEA